MCLALLPPMSKMPALLIRQCSGRCCWFQRCAKLLTDCREDTSSSMTSAWGLLLPYSFAFSSRDTLSCSPRFSSLQASTTAGTGSDRQRGCHLNRVKLAYSYVPCALRRRSAAAVSLPMPLQAQQSQVVHSEGLVYVAAQDRWSGASCASLRPGRD